jgi:hypothetical protein
MGPFALGTGPFSGPAERLGKPLNMQDMTGPESIKDAAKSGHSMTVTFKTKMQQNLAIL